MSYIIWQLCYLIRQPCLDVSSVAATPSQQADDNNAFWSRQGRGNVQNQPRQDICNACLGNKDLATVSACPPASHKITLTFHTDFKCVYKPCLPE
jgi:hypothetical protein